VKFCHGSRHHTSMVTLLVCVVAGLKRSFTWARGPVSGSLPGRPARRRRRARPCRSLRSCRAGGGFRGGARGGSCRGRRRGVGPGAEAALPPRNAVSMQQWESIASKLVYRSIHRHCMNVEEMKSERKMPLQNQAGACRRLTSGSPSGPPHAARREPTPPPSSQPLPPSPALPGPSQPPAPQAPPPQPNVAAKNPPPPLTAAAEEEEKGGDRGGSASKCRLGRTGTAPAGSTCVPSTTNTARAIVNQ